MVREAILREVLRGGRVYYLYNDVENIQKAADRLAELVPEARIAIGHGQMRERELERVMNDFHHQRFNVLVCTTIIETGLDIPTANTIIIERADHFGLAQLHQLRGRVGRSHHQAYASVVNTASESDDDRRAKTHRKPSPRWKIWVLVLRWRPTRRSVAPGNCWVRIRAVRWKPLVSRSIWSCWKTPLMH